MKALALLVHEDGLRPNEAKSPRYFCSLITISSLAEGVFIPSLARKGDFIEKADFCRQTKIGFFWWGKVDSNHRRHRQQIYSLSPLATREFPHIKFLELVDGLAFLRKSHGGCNMPPACCQEPPFESGERHQQILELVDGLEPPTC